MDHHQTPHCVSVQLEAVRDIRASGEYCVDNIRPKILGPHFTTRETGFDYYGLKWYTAAGDGPKFTVNEESLNPHQAEQHEGRL